MGLLENLQSEIERRTLPGGGWASGSGRIAGIETTCYALMALRTTQEATRRQAIDLLRRTQNQDGSWPAFESDDHVGCWATALAIMALRFAHPSAGRIDKALRWLLNSRGREGHWLWNWKFRTMDRHVRFNPDKYGWPWFPGTVSWVVPTAFSLLALKQGSPCCRPEHVAERIRLGAEMLLDRACPRGGWNAGNGIVFGSALNAHIDTTAIALLALPTERQALVNDGLRWLRGASAEWTSAYSLAWTSLALLSHRDLASVTCVARLREALLANFSLFNTETLSLSAIAIRAAGGGTNPFQVH